MISRAAKKHNQQGMASIVVITVLIVILSLITLGFSRLMNRSVNNALNNQLSAAATYAAQSGINDAVKYIKDQAVSNPGVPVVSSTCNSTVLTQALASQANISGDGNTKITCLLINPNPVDAVYPQIFPSNSQVSKLITSGPMDKLMVSWQSTDPTKRTYPPSLSLDSMSNWSYTPILRATLYAVPANGNATGIISKTFFLFPQSSGGSFSVIPFNATADGSIVRVNCGDKTPGSFVGTADYDCNTIVTQLASALSPTPKYYYIRLSPIYNQADVKLKANDAGGSSLTFSNVQILIDVTSKSGNAVKRLQERLNADTTGSAYNTSTSEVAPDEAFRSAASICKRLTETTTPINTLVNGTQCGITLTNPPPPVPVTGGHSGETYTTAYVTGTVDPKDFPVTDCRFVYSTNANLSASTPTYKSCAQSVGSGKGAVSVSATLTDLSPATKYYYALCAANDYNPEVCDTSNLTGTGGDSFTTPTPPPTANISYNGTAGGTANPNFVLSFSFSCTYSSSAKLNLSAGQHGGGPVTITANSTNNSNYWAGGPFQYGDGGTASVTCSGDGGTTTSSPTGWRIPYGHIYVHINSNDARYIGPTINKYTPPTRNWCGDNSLVTGHYWVVCVNWSWDDPNAGGNDFCKVSWGGSFGSSSTSWIYERYHHSYDTQSVGIVNQGSVPNGYARVDCYNDLNAAETAGFDQQYVSTADYHNNLPPGPYLCSWGGTWPFACNSEPVPPPPPVPENPGPVSVSASSYCSNYVGSRCSRTVVNYSSSQRNGGITSCYEQWPANSGSGGSGGIPAPSGSFSIGNGPHAGNNVRITCTGTDGSTGSATAALY